MLAKKTEFSAIFFFLMTSPCLAQQLSVAVQRTCTPQEQQFIVGQQQYIAQAMIQNGGRIPPDQLQASVLRLQQQLSPICFAALDGKTPDGGQQQCTSQQIQKMTVYNGTVKFPQKPRTDCWNF
jgi:hypothetical protein